MILKRQHWVFGIIAVILLLIGIGYYYSHFAGNNQTEILTPTPTLSAEDKAKEYIKTHISEISSEKEVLGGKFYITNINADQTDDGKSVIGDVDYEDGHVAFSATFTFSINSDDSITLQSFEIKK